MSQKSNNQSNDEMDTMVDEQTMPQLADSVAAVINANVKQVPTKKGLNKKKVTTVKDDATKVDNSKASAKDKGKGKEKASDQQCIIRRWLTHIHSQMVMEEEEEHESETVAKPRQPPKVTIKKTKRLTKKKIVLHETTIQAPDKTPIQQIFEDLLKEVETMTLGYALMSLVDDTDLGRGPSLISRTINKRPINKLFIKDFKAKAEEFGLHNKTAENAIIVGVLPAWLEETSLENIHGGLYTNRVKWTPKESGDEPRNMILYNGNHRRHYMQFHHPIKDTYLKYSNAAMNLNTAKSSMKPSFEMAMKEGKRIIDKDGVWLVKFIDMDKLLSSNNSCLLQHQLAENTSLANHDDSDDDRLTQVLTMLSSIENVEEREEYINKMLVKLKNSRNDSLYNLLKDNESREPAMWLYRWPHMRSFKGKSGLSMRHFAAWNPVMGALMQRFANHFGKVLIFLSTPMEVPSLSSIEEEAKITNADFNKLRTKMVKLIHTDLRSKQSENSDETFLLLNDHYLEAWASLYITYISSTGVLELFGSVDDTEQKYYVTETNKYWLAVDKYCGEKVKKTATSDNSDLVTLAKYMSNKIGWIRSGLIVKASETLCGLPLPNKFLLPGLLKLYKDDKLCLEDAIIEIVNWVEPLAKYAIKQRESDERLRIWHNYTSALIAHANLPIQENQLLDILIMYRRSYLRGLRVWKENDDLALTKVKTSKDLLNKDFVKNFAEHIKAYREELKAKKWPDPPRRPDFKGLDLTGLTSMQAKFIKVAFEMLRVTAFPWENEENLTKTETLVNFLAFLHQTRNDQKRLLATGDGWNLRAFLGQALCQIHGVSEWQWWDGIHEKPDVDVKLDKEVAIKSFTDETTGNRMLRLSCSDQIRKDAQDAIKQVTKTVLVHRLGYIHTTLPSPPIVTALNSLVEEMLIETEKHVARMEDMELDIDSEEFLKSQRLTEVVQNKPVKLPVVTAAHLLDIKAFWKPISVEDEDRDRRVQQTHIQLKQVEDMEDWQMEIMDRKGEKKAQKKLEEQIQNISLFGKNALRAMNKDKKDTETSKAKATNPKKGAQPDVVLGSKDGKTPSASTSAPKDQMREPGKQSHQDDLSIWFVFYASQKDNVVVRTI
ncbi:hypothetical protein L210DRAFT_3656031 [Boletus edulis BED1]|uniref:Uncharacterized protein n=1 Tax=Boletus edulis BED1 TaxID=1328754 RepID=A0AAD4G5P7_BOLED|nr:hypothetical protein L210DRAFT_3656031 [Boletus edulis BED1]